MYRSVLQDAEFIRWSHEAVAALVAHNEKDHPETEGLDAYGQPARRCSLYAGLSCNEHVDAAVDVDTARDDGLVKVPFQELHPSTWLVSPAGEVSQVPEDEQFAPAKVRARVEALQKTLGAPVPARQAPTLLDLAAKADDALGAGRLRQALSRLAELARAVKPPHAALVTWIGAQVERVNRDVELELEALREDTRRTPAQRREAAAALLERVDVEVLGARPPVHAALRAYLAGVVTPNR